MLATARSEMTRLIRRRFVVGWLGLSALLAGMITAFVFTAAGDGTSVPASAPGGSFPSAADLAGSDGLVAGLGSASTMLGVVALSFWAIATADDYSTGLIRLLVQAEPRRIRLLGGKVLALVGWSAVAAAVATVVCVLGALASAGPAGISTAAWSAGAVGTVLGAWLHVALALTVWGTIGLAIAVIARSSAVAISVGVGYVLVVEGIIGLVAQGASGWLPGATLTALAEGGDTDMAFGTAVALGLAYATACLASAAMAFVRRDVVD